MIVLPDSELSARLDLTRTAYNSAGLVMHLFKSNTTITRATVLGDLVECDFDGYAPVALGTFGAVAVTAHVANTLPPLVTFTKTAGAVPNDVYGYFITNTAGTVLRWAERDPAAPVIVSATGFQYVIQTKAALQNDAAAP